MLKQNPLILYCSAQLVVNDLTICSTDSSQLTAYLPLVGVLLPHDMLMVVTLRKIVQIVPPLQ